MASDTTTTLAALLTDGSIAASYALTIADRLNFLNHPVVAASYISDLAGMKSTTAEKSAYGYGANAMTAETEAGGPGSGAAETSLSVAALTATVAGYSLQREMSSLVTTIAGQDRLGAAALIGEDLAVAAQAGLMDAIAGVIDDFTNTESNTAADLELAHVLSALGTFRAQNMRGPIMGVLHSVQWSDLSTDIATSGSGSVQFSDAGAQLARYTDGSYQGNFLGVDWFISNRVVTANAGADRAGAIFGADGIVWATATPAVDSPATQALFGAGVLPMLVDIDRSGGAGVTEVTGRVFFGVSKGLENGVTIISDA